MSSLSILRSYGASPCGTAVISHWPIGGRRLRAGWVGRIHVSMNRYKNLPRDASGRPPVFD